MPLIAGLTQGGLEGIAFARSLPIYQVLVDGREWAAHSVNPRWGKGVTTCQNTGPCSI